MAKVIHCMAKVIHCMAKVIHCMAKVIHCMAKVIHCMAKVVKKVLVWCSNNLLLGCRHDKKKMSTLAMPVWIIFIVGNEGLSRELNKTSDDSDSGQQFAVLAFRSTDDR